MDDTSSIRTVQPEQCALWQARPVPRQMLYDMLKLVERLDDDIDDHLRRSLQRCSECGQLYFHEFYEVVDYVNSNDGIYQTWIPVADADSARALARLPVGAFFRYPTLATTNTWYGSEDGETPR